MIVVESRKGRRVVGCLDRGLELREALLALCGARGVRAGSLVVSGMLEDVELGGVIAGAPRPSRRISPPSTIVHFRGELVEREGKLHLEATCAIASDGESGPELCGGRLIRARVRNVDFVVEVYDDLLLRSNPHEGLVEAIELSAGQAGAVSSASALDPARGPSAAAPVEPARLTETASPTPVTPVATARPAIAPPKPAPAIARPAPAPAPTIAPRPTQSAPAASSMFAPSPSAAPKAAAATEPVSFEARATGHYAQRSPAPAATAPTPAGPAIAPAASAAMAPATTPAEDTDGDAGPSWADVAHESAAQGAARIALEHENDDALRHGDVIDHPRFGRCDVERIEGQSDYAQVRLRNKRLVRLSLDVINLVRDGHDEQGNRRFRALVQR